MFFDTRDRFHLLGLLRESAELYEWDVYSYCLMDTTYAHAGAGFSQALTLRATIISANEAGWFVADLGLKALGMDHGNPAIEGASVWYCADEHTVFSADGGTFAVGDRIRVIPSHIDPTVALHAVELPQLDAGGEVVVVGGHHAAFARRHVLDRVEGEAGRRRAVRGAAPDRPAFVRGAGGVGRVLQDQHVLTAGLPKHAADRIEIGRLAGEVDRDDHAGARGERRGQGLGTEATRLVLDFAFHVLLLRNVLLETLAWNVAGLTAYERAGFRRIGVRRGAALSRGRPTDIVIMDAVPEDFGESVLR